MRDGRGYDGEEYCGEGRRRQMPRRMRERDRKEVYSMAKKRRGIYFLIICLLLAMNLLLLLELQAQVRGLNRNLNQALSKMSAGWQENAPEPESQSKQDVPNQKYESAGPAGAEAKAGNVDYVSQCGLSEVDMPVDRSPEEVLRRLEELAQDNEQIAEIYENHSLYSDAMLKALANNPEMADFVRNSLYTDRNSGDRNNAKASLSNLEKGQDFPLFLQWDPRWGYKEYGDDNIGLSGCGPTCVSMAMYYLLRDETVTPEKVAEYGMENGHYVLGTGTAWALLEEFPMTYGVSVSQPKASEQTMKDVLDEGGVIICSMGPGDFTAGGHFIVVYGYDSGGFYINDSNCVARSREKWDYGRLEWQIKHMWVYSET